MKHQPAPRLTVGIRELKQNPSEIIAKAASGMRFDVLSNGKPVGVVIQRDEVARRRWVSTDALVAMSALVSSAGTARSTDTTGWAADLRAQRELDDDPIVDPWGTGSVASPGSSTGTSDQNAAEA